MSSFHTLFSPRTLILVCIIMLGVVPVSAQPSHPGASTDAPFEFRQASVTEGANVRNVDTGMLFPTVQAAVDAATAGDTLEVIPALFTEGQVFIDKDLTLRGEDGDEVVLAGVDTGSSGDNRAWFLIDDGVDLTVRDIGFDGDGREIYQGFRHKGVGLFENVTFDDIQFEVSGPAYQGTAIVAFGGNVTVRGCTFTDIGRVGVLFFDLVVTDALAENNTYTGKGDGDWLDYGIEVGGGATATLRNNVVTENRGVISAGSFTSGGLLVTTFFGPGTAADLISNTLLANTFAIQIGFPDDGDSSDVEASFNRIFGNDTGLESHAPNVDGERNWWGCNAGPDMSGCDTIGGQNPADVDPWLTLRIAADPTAILSTDTSDVTADVIVDSNGDDTTGDGAIPDITPLDFAATLGTIAPMTTTTTAGVATSLFTPTVDSGLADVFATVDNQTVDTQIVIGTADLVVVKTADPTIVPVGQSLVYTITVTNQGTADATNVVFVDTLPLNVDFVSVAPESQCNHLAGIVNCTWPLIAFGDTETVEIVVIPTLPGDLFNVAFAEADQIDPVPANNEDDAIAVVVAGVIAIPTLGEIGLGLLALMLASAAFFMLRRRV
ncbi:MAG: IPTL-CTERM sorting domain-containing protein [Acidobacteriota bacterium]